MGALKTETSDDAERIDRLIAAQEAQTNMLGRLIQVLQDERARKRQASAAGKARRPVLQATKPIKVTPMVEAQVKRALARLAK